MTLAPGTHAELDAIRGHEQARADAAIFATQTRLESVQDFAAFYVGQMGWEVTVLDGKATICPYVFHHPDGTRIKTIRKVWQDAREKAGYPQALLHDFRRTAARNLDRAGVPRTTAMHMVGHKTESIYRRYAIHDEATLCEAAAKLDAWNAEQAAKANVERRGQLRRFKKRNAG